RPGRGPRSPGRPSHPGLRPAREQPLVYPHRSPDAAPRAGGGADPRPPGPPSPPRRDGDGAERGVGLGGGLGTGGQPGDAGVSTARPPAAGAALASSRSLALYGLSLSAGAGV